MMLWYRMLDVANLSALQCMGDTPPLQKHIIDAMRRCRKDAGSSVKNLASNSSAEH